jgi:hypothetical protein
MPDKKYGAYDKCEDVRIPFEKSRFYDWRLGDLAEKHSWYLVWLNKQPWVGDKLKAAVTDMCAKMESGAKP